MKGNVHIVIMAGGIGSRFWPMSTPEYPKQFVDVLGRGKTMIQMTVERFLPLCPIENMWVVTSAAYMDLVRSQLPQIPSDNILLEPAMRNTAPCIGYAAWKIKARCPQANVVVTPADALVTDVDSFRGVISDALAFTESRGRIVTVGIRPTRPETGYGYIEMGNVAVSGVCGEGKNASEVLDVLSFREKPTADIAKEYLDSGKYLWNAGIFVWNVNTIEEAFRSYVPSIAEKMDEMAEFFYTVREKETVAAVFPTCEKISVDYAIMEKADYIYTIPGDFGWSDVGTWGSLWTLLEHDADGNAVVGGNVHLNECKGCIVHSSGASSVVLQGLEDSIVVERDGRILVCRLSEEQRIKDFIK